MVRWYRDSLCLFAIETTFQLSNFKTKHIFGILMEQVTFLKSFGAPEAPEIFYIYYLFWRPDRGAPGAPIFFLSFSFTAAKGGGFPTGAPEAPKGGAKGATPLESEGNPAEAGSSRVYINFGKISICYGFFFIINRNLRLLFLLKIIVINILNYIAPSYLRYIMH